MKKLSLVLVVALLAGILAACAPAATPTAAPAQPTAATVEPTAAPAEPTAAPAEPTAEPAKEPLRVAVIFSTTIKDGGYAQFAYESLMEMKEKHNLEVSFQESVTDAAVTDVLRNYAAEGYDLVIAHQLYFTDATNAVAAEFPDTKFAVSGGYAATQPNVVAIDATNWEGTYLIGVLAGQMTETNKLAIITVSESPIAMKMVNAFKNGARLYNPDAEVVHLFTGSFDDVVKAKEMATAAIKGGVDIVYGNSGMGTTGVIEAAKENNIYAFGSVADRNPLAPDTVITSNLLSSGTYITTIIEGYINGDLEWGKAYVYGVKEGVEYLAPYHSLESKVPQEVKDNLEKAKQDLIDGKVETPASEKTE